MRIKTVSGNEYVYNRHSNEIELGNKSYPCDRLKFKSFRRFEDFPLLDTFVIEITDKCNLRCTYCCYSGNYINNRTHGKKSLTSAEIDTVLKFIQKVHCRSSVSIGFYGGECLIEFKLIQYCVSQANDLFDNNVNYFISTNGVLLTPEKADWFVQNKFQLNISTDGTKHYNDLYRKDENGNGTFDKIYPHLVYIRDTYPVFFSDNVHLLMTLPNWEDLIPIAVLWNNDSLLKSKAPAHISNVAPNYKKGTKRIEAQLLDKQLYSILETYVKHPEYIVLESFLNERISDWLERPIFELEGENQLSTCMPNNRKLFIDREGGIRVCEKMCDTYCIGNIYDGIDWDIANSYVIKLIENRNKHCFECPIIRLCDICLTSLELSEAELSIFCHNQMVYTKAYLLIFCEMAERGLLTDK
ncbi:radical SAM protein [Parabacteroides segnis]|uniref:radical SAM protein n=1 Tax=Parabacteroides segnis TaxID=2763058 RepID=UPI003515563E